MIRAADFIDPALERGYRFWSGVPCSYLTPFINYVIQDPRLQYVGAASEGEAVAICAGAYLAGLKTVVICQNSGLGNTINPLTSLNYIFRIPTLLVVTHRGEPGRPDEPQHQLMGRVMEDLLKTVEVPAVEFPQESHLLSEALATAERSIGSSGLPFAFIMRKGTVQDHPLKRRKPRRFTAAPRTLGRFRKSPRTRNPRLEAIEAARDAVDGRAAIVGTTGHIGRELFSLGHRPNQFYVVGSMGCAAPIGLGLQLAQPARPVVVLDGDGAALMKLGAWGTIGHYQPRRLVHIVLDNEAHESTGAQSTVSSSMDFCGIAAACGYRRVWRTDNPQQLAKLVPQALRASGPSLIHVKVGVSSMEKLGRPTLTPLEVKEQFMRWMQR